MQQAKLVQLQLVADATREKIRGLKEDKDELTQRLAKLTKVHRDDTPPAADEGQEEAQAAMACLSKTLFGLQKYG